MSSAIRARPLFASTNCTPSIWYGNKLAPTPAKKVKYKRVMSRMNESCHVWMSHATYEWVMSHMNESMFASTNRTPSIWYGSKLAPTPTKIPYVTLLWHLSHVTYGRVISRMNESGHTTDGGDRTSNIYDCQNLQQVFTGVPVHIKHVFTGVPNISNKFSCE